MTSSADMLLPAHDYAMVGDISNRNVSQQSL